MSAPWPQTTVYACDRVASVRLRVALLGGRLELQCQSMNENVTQKQFNKQAKYFLIGYTKSTIKFSMTDEGMEGLILKCFV